MDIKDKEQFTPMMQHYLSVKENYPDCILFYRLGDFYEMFFEDAICVSKELELTLTGKSCGAKERAPMCGVPFHAVDLYINKLVKSGYKIAICEQLEDPKLAKGIVKRGVIRVITPGTNIDNNSLDESKNNYLLSISYFGNSFGMTVCDISTGDFKMTEIESKDDFINEIYVFKPSEILCDKTFYLSGIDLKSIKEKLHCAITELKSDYFDKESSIDILNVQFGKAKIKSIEERGFEAGLLSSGAILKYMKETQMSELLTILDINIFKDESFMELSNQTRRNLELTETINSKEKKGSLFWVLDHTKTAMGARYLRFMIEQPLRNKTNIEKRLDAVEELLKNVIDREELREYLSSIYDLERLLTKVSYRTANPRDLIALKNSLKKIPGIKTVLNDFYSSLLKDINKNINELSNITNLLENSIIDDAPASVHDGGIIKETFDSTVKELREAKRNGKQWLLNLEEKEKEKTGIKKLRVKYNKVFGYYIEVTNSFLNMVPDYFIRKQTLTNAERFYTEELKEMENKILGSEDRLVHLENEIYNHILDEIVKEVKEIQETAKALAKLDAFISISVASEKGRYNRPKINTTGKIEIKGGRHPVVEKMLKDTLFVDNDTYLDMKDSRVAIITGPNMAGKSTYMRQVALIVLMAQMGSFVPSESANIGICDRIFTRVGATDDLSSGQSTFMMEMNEVANILKHATKDSLLILDEIGRGTSTFDGLSIAWAVIEYVCDPKILGAKTLFATHYHELTELEGKLSGVHNFCSAVSENENGIVFLRKIVKGGADRSYGIEVARLAGLPKALLDRAEELLNEILKENENNLTAGISVKGSKSNESLKNTNSDEIENQMSFFNILSDKDIMEEIKSYDLSHMTPIDAMNTLNSLQKKVKNRW